jgi:hypothetical protein
MSSIPASNLVKVNPQVIGAGSNAPSLNGLFLTNTGFIPVGEVVGFATAKAVGDFFGGESAEKSVADTYFKSFDNSNIKPSVIYFYEYVSTVDGGASAYLRGGSLRGLTLAELQDVSGTVTITIDGDVIAEPVDFAAATDFADAADILGTALDVPVEYESLFNRFKIKSPTTGNISTIGFASGAVANTLKLSAGEGGYTSQGSDGFTLSAVMDNVTLISQDFATFTTMFEPDAGGKDALAVWTDGSDRRYAYIAWDTDEDATATGGLTDNFGLRVIENEWNGIAAIYGSLDTDARAIAAFVMGAGASIDFSQTNGRITFAFKGQTGLTVTVTDEPTANALIANGYNFYGQYATANQQFKMYQNGSVSGEWKWLDTYLNQIYFNGRLQQRLVEMLTSVNSLPYNRSGYDIIQATCMSPINEMINFGGIRTGIPLSLDQAAAVNGAAGLKIDGLLTTNGYYVQILAASAEVREARQTPPIKIWYTDGGSIQKLELDSINVL